MKIVQTFWTGSAVPAGHLLNIKAGWPSAEYHWMSWALSCLQLHKLYGQIELVTDDVGKKILLDTLGLPYTSVSTVLQDKLNNYPPELWSLAKIIAFAVQQEPFLHVDGDFFIWQPFDTAITQAGVVAQNLEVNLSYYRDMLQDMEKQGWRMPPVLQGVSTSPVVYAVNTGIFGGHQLDFIQQYCCAAFEFIDSNTDIIPKTQKKQLNFIAEQCLLYYLAQQQGVAIECLMPDPVDDPAYHDYARFVDVPNVKMVHTLGGYKTMPFVCSQMTKRLRNDFPEYYYRIMALCKEIGVANKIYHVAPFNSVDFYPQQFNKGLQQFLSGNLVQAKPQATSLLTAANANTFAAAFSRTCQVLTLFVQSANLTIHDYNTLQQWMDDIKNATWRAIAEEIFVLESRALALSARMQQPDFLQYLYYKDCVQYRQITTLFTKPEQEILAAIVGVDEAIEVLGCSRDWDVAADDIKAMLTEEDKEETTVQVVLQADWENGRVAELYPEGIDRLIIDYCSKTVAIADIVEELQQYFDEAEIAANYNTYQQLILDTVKQLLLNGLLRLC